MHQDFFYVMRYSDMTGKVPVLMELTFFFFFGIRKQIWENI